jgi:cyclic dehypoxanthinyl futalosine synthase
VPLLRLLPQARRSRGYLLPNEEIGRKIEETLALNGTGILMQGGVHPDLPLTYYEELLGYIRSQLPGVPRARLLAAGGEVHRQEGAHELLRRDRAPQGRGLQSIPGGGAEILSDDIRKEVLAYPKASPRVDRHHAQAHKNGLRTSATDDVRHGRGPRGARRALPAHP